MTIFGIPGAIAVASAVILAAYWDLLYRRIPNRLTGALLGLYVTFVAWSWARSGGTSFPPPGLAFGAGCAVASLAAGYVLFCLHAVGAGDVKLTFALCLWLGDGAFTFLLATAMAGGVMILQMPMLRQVETLLGVCTVRLARFAGRISSPIPAALTEKNPRGLPYGPAIAAGTFFTLLRAWA